MTHARHERRDTDDGSPTADRPAGTVDEDANPPLTDPTTSDVDRGTGNIPPQDTGQAIPPYEGRQTAAKPESGDRDANDARSGGAAKPVSDADYKSPPPDSTPGGATASPADEQPAAKQSERDLDDDRVGPAHTSGTRRGEDKP